LICPLKSQNPARQSEAVSEEGGCCPPSLDGGHRRLAVGSLFTSPFSQIQVILDREHEIARQQLAAGHKDRALVALRKRKYQEGLLVKTDGQLENLEQVVCTPAMLSGAFPPPSRAYQPAVV
jgi:Snf7